MTQDLWDNVLMLLAVMVIADGYVETEELESFVKGVKQLQVELEPDAPLRDDTIRAWYDLNEARARGLSKAEPFDMAIMPYLTALTELPNLQLLLDKLAEIADSDMFRVSVETDLLTLAAAFWGLVRPRR